jgi:hypothetical protein
LRGSYQVALKRLSAVEMDRGVSHQHELNGVNALRELLGSSRRHLAASWVFLRDDGAHVSEEHHLTWYDSRENHPTRSEWRLYFDGPTIARPGDMLAVLRDPDTDAFAFLIAPMGTSWERQIVLMVGAPEPSGRLLTFTVTEVPGVFTDTARELFEVVGWTEEPVPDVPAPDWTAALSAFGGVFPPSEVLSKYVREHTSVDLADPDDALLRWWQAEESLFVALERGLVEQRLSTGFDSVNEFLSFSLSVQNRRKSRAGRALEHHLRAIFDAAHVRYSFHPFTEGARQPDFVLPGIAEYRDSVFPADRLLMLGAKTTCKDRWRQVLVEAARIPRKHLCTLEPGISSTQLREMREEELTLVVPRTIISTYGDPSTLWTLAEFIHRARFLEGRPASDAPSYGGGAR